MGLGVKQLKHLAAQSLGCCGCWGGERLCRCRSRLLSAAPQIASNQKQGASFPQVALTRKRCASSWNLQWWTNQIRIKSGTWYENLVTRGHYRNSVCIVCFHLKNIVLWNFVNKLEYIFMSNQRQVKYGLMTFSKFPVPVTQASSRLCDVRFNDLHHKFTQSNM